MKKDDILAEIVARETKLLQALYTAEPVPANTLPAFKRMRQMTYIVLSEQTLASWLNDLQIAERYGRNPLMEKYALIAGQIAPLKENPLIGKIVAQEMSWMAELSKQYPRLIKREAQTVELFENYAQSELQSWSDASIELYWQDIQSGLQRQENYAQLRYEWLAKSLGKGCLLELENSL